MILFKVYAAIFEILYFADLGVGCQSPENGKIGYTRFLLQQSRYLRPSEGNLNVILSDS